MLNGLNSSSVLGTALLGSGANSVLQVITFLLCSNKQGVKGSREGEGR